MTQETSVAISESNPEKTVVSARVNKKLVELYKESDIPLGLVVESALVFFMKLDEKGKIKFLSDNLTEKVGFSELKPPKKKWNSILRSYVGKLGLTESVTATLFSGVCIGAIALLGGILNAAGSNIFGSTTEEESKE